MGRELRRVPMDFDWPLDTVWGGYLNPHQPEQCAACEGSGSSPQARYLHNQWYGSIYPEVKFDPTSTGSKPIPADHPKIVAMAKRNCEYPHAIERECLRLAAHFNAAWCHHLDERDVKALLKSDRLMEFTHTPRDAKQEADSKEKMAKGGNSWLPYNNGYVPTAAEVNEWSIGGFGHDSINSWICITAKCKRLGYPSQCAVCNGQGEIWPDQAIKKAHDKWRETKPPEGDGYQLWTTTTEGSPISPVFKSLKELCDWSATGATTFGSSRATSEEWESMLSGGLVCHKEGNMIFI